MVATLSLLLHLPGCHSLKEKRGFIQPLIHRLHRKFNLSVAEMDLMDVHQKALITCALAGNDHTHLRSALENVTRWVEANLPEGEVLESKIEVI